ncbi:MULTISPECIES: CDP-alcohol phosphatidyltransferase family protein [unclassified Pseudonocardia]|uniref:CDP-alcohol phosphatidyltransferase family protein n=1 Tax=unclassified Pseudonocardia TaxID=2619320 RepID=UPI000963CB0E|nr:CDP-alcohol phosphatidyltransferase family protein [Pseudonocardia sp. Ae707_Ps1]OLM15963.1 CDP-alcohol phosphatidyltransferase [Pseudonocardia sp. Ae707_Ps1]
MIARPERSPAVASPLVRQLAGATALLAVVLAGSAAVTGAGVLRTTAGVLLAALILVLLVRAARRAGETTLGPAGLVTVARGTLVVGAATLVGRDDLAQAVLVGLTVVALALDAVDGVVARRTGTATAFGARFDMETDALLLLVLSAHVTATSGEVWVLALGLMRYAYVGAARILPWLDGELPVRRSAKVVAAVQGIVLIVTAAGLLPRPVETAALAVALVALLWSFGSSVAWRWRAVDAHPVRLRVAAAGLLTVAAAALVTGLLVLPGDPSHLAPQAFLRLPVEAVAGIALLAVLPGRLRAIAAAVAGTVVALLGLLKALDIGFGVALGRSFDPVADWVLLGNAREFLQGAGGSGTLVAVLAALAVLGLVVATAGAVVRLGRLAARHRRTTLACAAVLGAAWLVVWAAPGGRLVPGVPIAAADGVAQLRDRASQIPSAVHDRYVFSTEAAQDDWAGVPADRLLAGLRGKDVVFAVVESYGRSAIEDPAMAPAVGPVLAEGDRRLADAGFASRSGFLTSPVTGGGSWLAHATLFSGLRIGDQARHQQLVGSDRLTLTRAFRDAGWETTAVMPGTTRDWPEAAFYGHQRVHAFDGLGYRGPPFSWSPMPDQYALSAFDRLEYGRTDRGPLMAEVALTSSHAPWSPVPPLLPWDRVGDGSAYTPYAHDQRAWDTIWTGDPAAIRADYVRSTEYSLETLYDWVSRFGDDRLVVVVLGDHQPAPMVVGQDAGRDVPISVVTRDQAVLDRIAGWGWTPGLRPPPTAPVQPMEDFRDRFLSAFNR